MTNGNCVSLLADPNFRALANLSQRRCLTWDEFLAQPQPRDTSPLDTWAMLEELAESLSVPINIPDLDDNLFWYRRTHELDTATSLLSCACKADSHLDRVLNASSGQHFLVWSRMEETIAAAQLDGLSITEEAAKNLLRSDRTPQNATERLLVNAMNAFDHLPELADQRFSPELFHQLAEMLLAGVDASSLHHQTPSLGTLVGLKLPDDLSARRMAEQQLTRLADYLNGDTADKDDIPVLRALLMADAFRFNHALGVVSSQVGRLSGRLYALKNGFPVLSMLPVSRAKNEWERGAITPPHVSFDRASFLALRERNEFASTAHQTLTTQLALIALGDVQSNIETWEARDTEMRQILRADPLLNHRQRTVLARALRDPESEFRIRYHQTNHNIHYTTARRDLLELHEKGYLGMEQRGKAFVFVPGPKLFELAPSGRSEAAVG